jgi:hypothetical protein
MFEVSRVGLGEYNVKFFYKGYTISLAADQSDTWVWSDGEVEHVIVGCSAETIREAMEWIDGVKAKQDEEAQAAGG